MKTWLFTWDPKRWQWDDKYDGFLELIHQISQVGRSFATWSCEVNKSIKTINLLKNRFQSVCWSSQSSCIQIPAVLATKVETMWKNVEY